MTESSTILISSLVIFSCLTNFPKPGHLKTPWTLKETATGILVWPFFYGVDSTEMTGNEGRDRWGMTCNKGPRLHLNRRPWEVCGWHQTPLGLTGCSRTWFTLPPMDSHYSTGGRYTKIIQRQEGRRVQASGQDLEMALQMFYEERNAFFRPQRSTERVFRIKVKVGLQEQGTFKVILLCFYFKDSDFICWSDKTLNPASETLLSLVCWDAAETPSPSDPTSRPVFPLT